MTDEGRRSRIALIALLSGVGLVVAVALIAVFARGGPAQYGEGTPEGVVQRYSRAVVDADVPTALEFLVPDVAESCDRVPLGTDDQRITLAGTAVRGDTARVTVVITTIYGSRPLGSSEYRSEEVFDLVKVDGDWMIETAPWQLAVCADSGSR